MITILIALSFFTSFGQTKSEYQFAKRVFSSKEYVKSNYNRFSEKIESFDYVSDSFVDTNLTSHTFRYGQKTIIVRNLNQEFMQLFKKGIFNPDVIFGKETSKMSKVKFDSLTESQQIIYNLTRNDSLTISGLEELKKLNPNFKTKRFSFLVWRIGFANPTEYYIEFYNGEAKKKSGFNEFIENSTMSFFYRGTILI
jgi:hypothetical protein